MNSEIDMDLSPQKILQALPRVRERGVKLDRLIEALSLTDAQADRLRGYLAEFVRTGLAASKGGRFWRKQGTGLLIGTLRGTRSGHAFVLPDDERERDSGDLYIAEHNLGAALHEDKVIARVIGTGSRRREGRIEAVLYQANPTVVGRFVKLKYEIIV